MAITHGIGEVVHHDDAKPAWHGFIQRLGPWLFLVGKGVECEASIGNRKDCLISVWPAMQIKNDAHGCSLGAWPAMRDDVGQRLVQTEIETSELFHREAMVKTSRFKPC